MKMNRWIVPLVTAVLVVGINTGINAAPTPEEGFAIPSGWVASPDNVKKAGEAGYIIRNPKIGLELLYVPGGNFLMGSTATGVEQKHEVELSAYWIGRTEVTVRQWRLVMDKLPPPDDQGRDRNTTGEDHPVTWTTWDEARQFCQRMSLRLPTEAEWEYAARAGATTAYSFADVDAELIRHAWFKANAGGKPHPVGQRKPNAWGLYDMHGNVWEWCNDFYKVDYYAAAPAQDPKGPDSGDKKVLRGGCWNSTPDACRVAYRYNENPAYSDACFGYDIYGFRCVRSYRETPSK